MNYATIRILLDLANRRWAWEHHPEWFGGGS